jgi:hypothetical protein
VRPPGTVPVSGPGLRFCNCETGPDRGFSEQAIERRARTGVFGRRGVTALYFNGFGDRFPLLKKKLLTLFFAGKGEWEPKRAWVRHPRPLWAATTCCRLKASGLIYLDANHGSQQVALSTDMRTRAPGHRSPGPWSQGIFLFYFYFFWWEFIFFKAWMRLIFLMSHFQVSQDFDESFSSLSRLG